MQHDYSEKDVNSLKLVDDKNNQNTPPQCRYCGGSKIRKSGTNRNGKQTYYCSPCKKRFVLNPEWEELKESDNVWKASTLGFDAPSHISFGSVFNFNRIQQEWLREAAKRYLYYASATKKHATLKAHFEFFVNFANFLDTRMMISSIEDVDRDTVIDFIAYLKHKDLASETRNKHLSFLSTFFEAGELNYWFKVKPYLIRKEDFVKGDKPLPRYIPEEVMLQLNQHLDALPEPIMRMVLVIQECGLRIGELCLLPINCLHQDSKGCWYIQFMRLKTGQETTLPISVELAQVIQEQQKYIRENLGYEFDYLFCGRKKGLAQDKFVPLPKVTTSGSFANYLKKLAIKFDIKDSSGKHWNFQTHQFRHTVGTRMINNGVPQHIVQRYLGHASPEMTAVYAYIHDETLKQEIAKFIDTKVVNINGEVIKLNQELANPEIDKDIDLQWLKKKITAETLPNGYCGLPTQFKCGKGNACLTCADFRTTVEFLPQHQEHLERAKEAVELAQARGWERQVQINQEVVDNLTKIVESLEGQVNE